MLADQGYERAENTVRHHVNELRDEGLLEDLQAEYGEELDRIAASMAPCEHRRTQKYETYLLLTVLRRAFVRGYVGAGDG